MTLFDLLADRKIDAAVQAGELDHLPGAGRPLTLDDDRMVPEDLRAAYRILKNAGYVPPELEARKEAASLQRLLRESADDVERARALARLALLETMLEERGRTIVWGADYRDRALARLGH